MSGAPNGIGGWVTRLIVALVASRRRAAIALLVVLAAAFGGARYGAGIRTQYNLEALLAKDDPAVAALTELRSRQRCGDPLYVAVKSDDPAANRRATADIAAAMSEWDDVLRAYAIRDFTPLRDRALYFLDDAALLSIRDRLNREHQTGVAKAMSLGVGDPDGGGGVPAAAIVNDDWDAAPEDLEPSGSTVPGRAAEAPSEDLDQVLEDQRAALLAQGWMSAAELDLMWPRAGDDGVVDWPDEVGAPIASEDGRTHLVRACLRGSATDVEYARDVATRVEALFERLDLESYAPGMMAKIGGAWTASNEASSIMVDLRRATTVSAVAVGLVLLLGFRTWKGLLVVALPVVVATGLTLAAARSIFGELNVLTAFLFAVLLGVGVDFSVHLYALRQAAAGGGGAPWAGILRAHLRPLAASMATTVASFLVLTFADFKSFREFGAIAAVGVALCFVSALVIVPLVDRLLGTASIPSRGTPLRVARPVRWGLIAAMVGVGLLGAPHMGFEQDLRNLRAPETKAQSGISYTKALGKKRSGTPVVILADDAESLNRAVASVQADRGTSLVAADSGKKHAGEPWVRDVISLDVYMPKNMASKRERLHEIEVAATRLLNEAEHEDLSPGERSQLQALQRLARATPLTHADLPAWAREPFEEIDGTVDRIGLVYMRLSVWDLAQVSDVTDRFRALTSEFGVRGASSRFILADLATAVNADARRLPPWSLLAIALLIFLDLRSLKPAATCFGALALGLAFTAGVMGLWPIRINFYNLVVLPAVIGLGIDASIHLWHARHSGQVGPTARAALISALTTAGAFGGLWTVAHRGLRSIGQLGVVATLCSVAAALVALALTAKKTQA